MKRLVIFLVLLLAVAGAVFGWWLLRPDPLTRYIPASALWVYQHDDAGVLAQERIQKHVLKPLFQAAEQFAFDKDRGNFWRMLKKDKALWQSFLAKQPFILSEHARGGGRSAWMAYLSLSTQKLSVLQQLFSSCTSRFASAKESNSTARMRVLVWKETELYYLLDKDYVVLSFEKELVQEAIDTKSQVPAKDFVSLHSRLEQLPQLEKHEGSLWINIGAYARHLMQRFRPEQQKPEVEKKAVKTTGIAKLEAHLLQDHLLFTGFLVGESSAGSSSPKKEEALPTEVPYLYHVPKRCFMSKSYAFANAVQWNFQQRIRWEVQRNPVITRRQSLFSRYGIEIDALFAHIGQLAAKMRMPSFAGEESEELFLVHLKKRSDFMGQLAEIARRRGGTQSQYHEVYLGHDIQYLELRELPYLLFGDLFSGFGALFYTQRQGFLLASSSLWALKSALEQLENEESWFNTPAYQKQLQHRLPQANYSFHVNLSSTWPFLGNGLRYPWYGYFEQIQPNPSNPSFFSYQTRRLEDQHQVQVQLYPSLSGFQAGNAVIARADDASTNNASTNNPTQPPVPQGADDKTYAAENESLARPTSLPTAYTTQVARTFEHPLRTPPLLCYNPFAKRFDVFVQEQSSFRLHALDTRGKTRWSRVVNEAIISPIYGLDYAKNNRMHYLFATRAGVYVLDEQGRPLGGFPRALPEADSLAFLSLLDYSKNKFYRFFVADIRGQVYVLDKQGKALAGWQPKRLGPLAQAPFHQRYGQRDVMFMFQKDGFMQMYKRAGSSYKGFPQRIGLTLAGEVQVSTAPSLARARLRALSTQGEFTEMDLEGNILTQKPLATPGGMDFYYLVTANTGKDFLMLAANNQKLHVYDSKHTQLFDIDNPSKGPLKAQYYALGGGADLLVLRDTRRGQAYFYDLNGQLVLPSPIPTQHRLALTYRRSNPTYTLYLCNDNTFYVLSYRP